MDPYVFIGQGVKTIYLLKKHLVRIDYTTNVSTEIYLFQMTFYTVQVLSD